MTIQLVIEPKVLYYEGHELEAWKKGVREGVSDDYLRHLNRGSTGFGEFIVGRHFEQLGYRYIHHDFDLFGDNKPKKYPKSEEVLARLFCNTAPQLESLRTLQKAFKPFADEHHDPMETPDLLVYKPDYSEFRFVECKREDTYDKVNHRQIIGLLALATLLRCTVDVFLVRLSGVVKGARPIEFTYGS